MPNPTVFSKWHSDPAVEAVIFCHDKDAVAYGELWIDVEANEVEIARIIVDPQFRSRGIGSLFVSSLCTKIRARGISNAILRVIPGNSAAIACYRKAGFRRVPIGVEQEWNCGQPIGFHWFQRTV